MEYQPTTSGQTVPLVWDLQKKYNNPLIKSNASAFFVLYKHIADLNEKLGGIVAEEQPDEYNQIVQKIVETTQDYYTLTGSLPEQERRLFTNVAAGRGSLGPGEDLAALQELMGDFPSMEAPHLLSWQSIRPQNYVMPMDAISSQLADLGKEKQLQVGRQNNQPVLTTVTLDMPDHMQIEGGRQLSSYDKSIINGVTSLMESGNAVFSIPMLYHAMTGRQNPTVDEVLYDDISEKLELMRRMMLTIDLSEEYRAKFIEAQGGDSNSVANITLEGYLLPLNKITGEINGKKTELYQLIQHPPLYTYAKMRHQLASVHISLLSVPVNNNATTIPLKTYLIQRIEAAKAQAIRADNVMILYASIYGELGAMEAGKTKKMRIRTYAEKILDYFVEQQYIKEYHAYKEGRTISGINVIL